MAQPQPDPIPKIRDYAAKSRALYEDSMDLDPSETESRLSHTINELQARVQEQQAALENLRTSRQDIYDAAYASTHPRTRLQQLQSATSAYQALTPIPPFLPTKPSVLPALITVRTILSVTHGTKSAVSSTEAQLKSQSAALAREEADLADSQSISRALDARIDNLSTQRSQRSQRSPAQLAKEMIRARQDQKRVYDVETERLETAFYDFLSEELSAQLAAEELGGPVVGNVFGLEDDELAAGFTKAGKPRSLKKPVAEDKRQKRLTEIWGTQTGADETEDDGTPVPLTTESEGADLDMRKLIENLMAVLHQGGSAAYYELPRDSAASRFLVRSKIAVYHPKDGRKIRLVDFGRELDD